MAVTGYTVSLVRVFNGARGLQRSQGSGVHRGRRIRLADVWHVSP